MFFLLLLFCQFSAFCFCFRFLLFCLVFFKCVYLILINIFLEQFYYYCYFGCKNVYFYCYLHFVDNKIFFSYFWRRKTFFFRNPSINLAKCFVGVLGHHTWATTEQRRPTTVRRGIRGLFYESQSKKKKNGKTKSDGKRWYKTKMF